MAGRQASYFERYAPSSATRRLDEIVALQRGVIGSHIHLIASACYPFDSVLRALAEPSFVLPVEGMPHERYLPGAGVMDIVEEEGESLALGLFGSPDGYAATLQPHSGTQANQIVFNATLRPDDVVLSLRPRDGGHISHTVLLSRRHAVVSYGLTDEGLFDYEEMRQLALRHRPRLMIVGGSALPRAIDFETCSSIAKEVGALVLADVSHTATFIAAGLHASAFPHCDFVTFNFMKNLRGPNAGLLIYRAEFAGAVRNAIFPTTQGGANESGMLAKLACLLEWQQRDINAYARGIVSRAQTLASELAQHGVRLVSGGTDSHMLLLDLHERDRSGAEVERDLESLGVLANRNLVPGDLRSPRETSGIRVGATNLAILGYEEADLRRLAAWLARVATGELSSSTLVKQLVDKYQRHLVAPVW